MALMRNFSAQPEHYQKKTTDTLKAVSNSHTNNNRCATSQQIQTHLVLVQWSSFLELLYNELDPTREPLGINSI